MMRDVWVWCEWAAGGVHPVAAQLLAKGRELAARTGGQLAAVLTQPEADTLALARAQRLAAAGADRLYCLQAPACAAEEAAAAALAALVCALRPAILLAGATARGRSLLPRTAALCGTGLTADCTGLSIDDARRLVQTRPAFGGSILAEILTCGGGTQMATVRPGVFRAVTGEQPLPERIVLRCVDAMSDGLCPTSCRPSSDSSAGAALVADAPREGAPASALSDALQVLLRQQPGQPSRTLPFTPPLPVNSRVLERMALTSSGVNLHDARIIVAGGRGVGVEGFALLQQLARALGGALAASRAAVDAGWQPPQRQVGQTGTTVAPAVYLAFGISGAGQHLAGMRGAGTVIAVNRDPDAPMLAAADYALVADWREVATALLQAASG